MLGVPRPEIWIVAASLTPATQSYIESDIGASVFCTRSYATEEYGNGGVGKQIGGAARIGALNAIGLL